ncbi:hypothetical protein Agabi119p4_6788 [Agaricus bisporus var. burnettii]|uniref:Uncharacterized protein n=1 Tax=Agaricus bisporus var. burnettii TaxID=192524 RepID=A0A8H7F026_AGABI|nr:hypothetical protein Agabi119p4_6788 [Agaricus bisporus var. burnettii]
MIIVEPFAILQRQRRFEPMAMMNAKGRMFSSQYSRRSPMLSVRTQISHFGGIFVVALHVQETQDLSHHCLARSATISPTYVCQRRDADKSALFHTTHTIVLRAPLPIHDEDKPVVSSTLSMPTGALRPLPPDCFTDVQNFVLNHANFTRTVNHIHHASSKERTIFYLLEPYTMLDATKASGARYPPPQCRPKTSLNIMTRLANWLYDEKQKWKAFYICGFAGTGKPAIVQSFADPKSLEEPISFRGWLEAISLKRSYQYSHTSSLYPCPNINLSYLLNWPMIRPDSEDPRLFNSRGSLLTVIAKC